MIKQSHTKTVSGH